MNYRDCAVENFIFRLRDGKSVDGLTLADLIDADLSGPRCEAATMTMIDILLSEYPDTPAKQDAYLDDLIQRFLADPKREVLIQEEMATLEADALEAA